MNLLTSVRWDVLSGADVLWEYRTARDVLTEGWWNWGLADNYRYFSSLSVSIFPAIISEVTGLDLLLVFSYVLPIFCSLVPIFIFLLAHQAFHEPKLAFLSAIIYAESYFTIPSFGREIKRQPLAIIFLLCSLMILLRLLMQKEENAGEKRKLIVLLSIFSLGVVVSHYTISYFLVAILLAIFLVLTALSAFKTFLSKILRMSVPSTRQLRICVLYLISFSILCVAWNIAISPNYTLQYVDYFRSMLTGGFQKRLTQLETAVVFDVLGPVVTPWLFMVLGLCGIGFLFLLRENKDINKSVLMTSGGLFFIMYPLWIVRSQETSWYMSLTRFIGVSFILICIFGAYLLLKADKKFRGIVVVVFILINLPMNMLLPVYSSYVLYSREATVPVDMAIRQLYCDQHDLEVARWINRFVDPSEVISTDTPGAHKLFYSNNIFAEVVNASYGNGKAGNILSFRPFTFVSRESLHSIQSRYVFLSDFAVQDGFWYVVGPARDFRETGVNMTYLLSSGNKIYDDGTSVLIIKQ